MAKRILVVEDEPDHRELLQIIFSVHGYDVETAANAGEALEHIAQHVPDAMIVDVMLPDMDGWHLCERTKSMPEACHVPVLVLSASANLQQRFENSCADDMLTKPFDDRELLEKIRHLTGESVSQ